MGGINKPLIRLLCLCLVIIFVLFGTVTALHNEHSCDHPGCVICALLSIIRTALMCLGSVIIIGVAFWQKPVRLAISYVPEIATPIKLKTRLIN